MKIELADVVTIYTDTANAKTKVEWDQRTGAVRVYPNGTWTFPDIATVARKLETK